MQQNASIHELQLIDIHNYAYTCTNWNCQCTQHKDGLDSLCQISIDYCIDASRDTIPMTQLVVGTLSTNIRVFLESGKLYLCKFFREQIFFTEQFYVQTRVLQLVKYNY